MTIESKNTVHEIKKAKLFPMERPTSECSTYVKWIESILKEGCFFSYDTDLTSRHKRVDKDLNRKKALW